MHKYLYCRLSTPVNQKAAIYLTAHNRQPNRRLFSWQLPALFPREMLFCCTWVSACNEGHFSETRGRLLYNHLMYFPVIFLLFSLPSLSLLRALLFHLRDFFFHSASLKCLNFKFLIWHHDQLCKEILDSTCMF